MMKFEPSGSAFCQRHRRRDGGSTTTSTSAEAAHALWTYSGVGGPDAQEAVLGVGFLDVIKSGLEQARVADKRDGKDSRVRKFVGCALALAVGNENAQDALVREGLRSLVRKSLVEFSAISFHGEFAELRDWIRGDRGGARSAGKSSTAREKALAENTLSRDATETGARTHAEAQRMQSGVDTPPDYRPAVTTTSQTTSHHTLSTTTRQSASHAETSLGLLEEREAFAGVERVTRKMSSSPQTHVVKEKASATYISNAKINNSDDPSTLRRTRWTALCARSSRTRAVAPGGVRSAGGDVRGVSRDRRRGGDEGRRPCHRAAIAGGSSAFVAGAFALLHVRHRGHHVAPCEGG